PSRSASETKPGATKERIHAHAEWRTHVSFASDGLAHRHRRQRLPIPVDLRAGHVNAVKLPLERTGTTLRRLERNERSAGRSLGRQATSGNSKVSQHALHPARSRVDALFKVGEGGSLFLLDLVERQRNTSQHATKAARRAAFGNAGGGCRHSAGCRPRL